MPSFNIINGGTHAGNGLAMQEFMIMPVGAANFTEAMKMGSEVYHNLKVRANPKVISNHANMKLQHWTSLLARPVC